METSLLFISIIPPKEIYDKIKEHQKVMSEQFDSHKSYGHIPHITLIPPFHIDASKDEELKAFLSNFKEAVPFKIEIDGFSHFKKHTVFAAIKPSDELVELHTKLLERLNSTTDLLVKKISYFQKYNPHITIAYKDIEPNFKEAWSYFENVEFNENFKFERISLLQYDGEKWSIV